MLSESLSSLRKQTFGVGPSETDEGLVRPPREKNFYTDEIKTQNCFSQPYRKERYD